jgi:hypothetical protein
MATNKTKNEGRVIAVVAIVLGAAVCQPAATQEPERLTVDVHDCLALEKRDERLACFEAQVAAAQQRAAPARGSAPVTSSTAPVAPSTAFAAPSPAPAAPSPVPVAPRPAPAAASAALVVPSPAGEGRSDENFGRGERRPDTQPAEIVAKVAELRETIPNSFVITLDNGQVWRQAQPMAYPLRPGLDVRLRQTKFGYRLSAPELRGQIPVERVR